MTPTTPPDGLAQDDFDAGDLSCGTGLAAQFRGRLASVAPGARLRVVTRDAGAREDLPALARLLGHRVVSVETGPGGETVVTVERGT